MNDRGRSKWHSGKSSNADRARDAAALPDWKKQPSRTKSGQQTGSLKWRGKPLLVFGLLLTIVMVAIWLWNPKRDTHTLFVSIDPLNNDQIFDSVLSPHATAFGDENDFEARWESQLDHYSVDSCRWTISKFADWQKRSKNEYALIIYLQAHLLPGENNEFWYLTDNSKPDLKDTSQHENLSELKSSIQQALKEQLKASVVLLVDPLQAQQDWRLGALPVQDLLKKELKSWTNDFSKLTVILNRGIQPHPGGGNGQTAFGVAVSDALSTMQAARLNKNASNSPRDQDVENRTLRVSELRKFMEQRIPDVFIAGGKADDAKLVQFNSTDDADGAPSTKMHLPFDKQLQHLWETRHELNQKQLAWRWDPLSWNRCTESLLRAQTALLNGDKDRLEMHRESARGEMDRLERLTNRIVPTADGSENEDVTWKSTGMSPGWVLKSPGTPIENILEANAKDVFNCSPEDEQLWTVLEQRKTAEEAVGNLLSLSGILQELVTNQEQKLLDAEDRFFQQLASSEEETPQKANAGMQSEEDWEQLLEFTQRHQQAETLVQNVLRQSESLARWSSGYPEPMSDDAQQDLADVKSKPPTKDYTASDNTDRAPKLATNLKQHVLHLLLSTRALQIQLYPTANDVQQLLAKDSTDHSLYTALKQTETSLARCKDRLEEYVNAIKDAKNDPQSALHQYHRVREVLQLADLLPKQRESLVKSALKLSEKHEPAAADTDEAAEDSASIKTHRRDQIFWQLQYLRLFQTRGTQMAAGASEPANRSASKITKAWRYLLDIARPLEDNEDLSFEEIAAFGKEIREFWIGSRDLARDAGTADDNTAEQDLWQADLLCRGLSAWDAKQLLGENRNPTAALHAWWQTDLCRLQIDRLQQGQWISNNEPQWYVETAKLWQSQTTNNRWQNSVSGGVQKNYQQAIPNPRQLKSREWELNLESAADVWVGGEENRQEHLKERAFELETPSNQTDLPDGLPTLLFQTPPETIVTDNIINFQKVMQDGNVDEQSSNQAEVTFTRETEDGEDRRRTAEEWTPEIFFRGHRFEGQQFTVHTEPWQRWDMIRTARPDTASVKVDGSDLRPLVFILDMSLSMDKELPSGKSRIYEALAVLKSVIEELNEEQRMQLTLFGAKVERDELSQSNPALAKVLKNRGVLRNLSENRWQNRDQTLSTLRTLEKAVRAEIVEPSGGTPLATSLAKALGSDYFKTTESTGLIVAVTDGFASDIGLNPREETRNDEPNPHFGTAGGIDIDDGQLRPDLFNKNGVGDKNRKNLSDELKNRTSVRVRIVQFAVSESAPAKRDQFDKALRGGRDRDHVDVVLVDDSNPDALRENIDSALQPRTYLVTQKGSESMPQLQTAKTGLQPGTVNVSFGGSSQSTQLNRGDYVILEPDWDNDGELVYRHVPPQDLASENAKIAEPDKAFGAEDPKRLICVDRKRNPEDSVEVLLMLDHNDDQFPVHQPAEIEFRYYTDSNAAQPYLPKTVTEELTTLASLSESDTPDAKRLGAPGYHITLSDWPSNRHVYVEAWWKMQPSKPQIVWEYSKQQPKPKLPDLSNIIGNESEVKDRVAEGLELTFSGTTEKYSWKNPSSLWQLRVEVVPANVHEPEWRGTRPNYMVRSTRVENGELDLAFFTNDRKRAKNDELKAMDFTFTSFDHWKQDAYHVAKFQVVD